MFWLVVVNYKIFYYFVFDNFKNNILVYFYVYEVDGKVVNRIFELWYINGS